MARRPLAPLAVLLLLLPAVLPAQTRVFAGSWGFGGTHRGRVYRYEVDTTWTELSPPSALGDAVWDLEWFDNALFASTHEGRSAAEFDPSLPPTSATDRPHGTNGRVWRNDGSGWEDVSPPGGFLSAATSLAILDGVLYATVDQDGLYRWDGSGWTLVDSFTLPGQSIASDMHDGQARLFIGQDNIDEFWSYDPTGSSPCPTPGSATCQIPPLGNVCTADCFGGSCIHAFADHDDGAGRLVYAGAFNGRMYHWDRSLYTFAQLPDVPASVAVNVQGLASYHDRLWVGMSDGRLMTTIDGSTPSYALGMAFGPNLPISEELCVPEQDLLWVGFGGVPYRWARIDGVSMVKTFDGTSWVDRSTPGIFGSGVLSMLAVTPTLTCDAGPTQHLECSDAPVVVHLDGTRSQVPNPLLDLPATWSWSGDFVEGTASGPTPTVHVDGSGDHVVTLTLAAGTLRSTCTMVVTVADTQAPAFEGGIACLWPPSHRYRCFPVTSLTFGGVADAPDGCGGGTVPIHVVDVRSSQPEDELGHGDGATNDDVLFDDTSVCVRQERQGVDGAGRDYVVLLSATDAAGNTSLREAIIHVPHDMRPDRRCDFHPVDPGLAPHAPPPLDPGYHEGTYPIATRPPRR